MLTCWSKFYSQKLKITLLWLSVCSRLLKILFLLLFLFKKIFWFYWERNQLFCFFKPCWNWKVSRNDVNLFPISGSKSLPYFTDHKKRNYLFLISSVIYFKQSVCRFKLVSDQPALLLSRSRSVRCLWVVGMAISSCDVPVCPPGVSVAPSCLSLCLSLCFTLQLLTVCGFYLHIFHLSISLSVLSSSPTPWPSTFAVLRRLQKRSGQMVSDDFRALLISTGNSLVLLLLPGVPQGVCRAKTHLDDAEKDRLWND